MRDFRFTAQSADPGLAERLQVVLAVGMTMLIGFLLGLIWGLCASVGDLGMCIIAFTSSAIAVPAAVGYAFPVIARGNA